MESQEVPKITLTKKQTQKTFDEEMAEAFKEFMAAHFDEIQRYESQT